MAASGRSPGVKDRSDVEVMNWLGGMDTDGDGVVSLQEFQAAGGSKQAFEQYDLNNDGVLDLQEMEAAASSFDIGHSKRLGPDWTGQEMEEALRGQGVGIGRPESRWSDQTIEGARRRDEARAQAAAQTAPGESPGYQARARHQASGCYDYQAKMEIVSQLQSRRESRIEPPAAEPPAELPVGAEGPSEQPAGLVSPPPMLDGPPELCRAPTSPLVEEMEAIAGGAMAATRSGDGRSKTVAGVVASRMANRVERDSQEMYVRMLAVQAGRLRSPGAGQLSSGTPSDLDNILGPWGAR